MSRILILFHMIVSDIFNGIKADEYSSEGVRVVGLGLGTLLIAHILSPTSVFSP